MSRFLAFTAGFLLLSLAAAGAVAAERKSLAESHRVVHLLHPKEGSGSDLRKGGVSCQSWRLGVETNNLRSWKTIPLECESYVGHYMLGHLYRQDSRVVVDAAIEYALTVNLTGNGKDAWVFDIDDTALSNLPYYAKHGFGIEVFNATTFDAWVFKGAAPALPETLRLYKAVKKLGIRPVLMSGRTENKRQVTEANLKKSGYKGWEKLLLKGPNVHGTAVVYKSGERKKLVEEGGYRIFGNIGDQWSDILGNNQGERTFKVPDPMYYIG